MTCFLILAVAFSVFPCSRPAASESDARLESLYAGAQAAQTRGDYRAAAASYQEILKLRPELAEAWANLGLMYQFLAEYQTADQHFQTALRKNPRLYVPNLFLGLNLLRQHKPKAAVPYLERAERLNPRDAQAALGLARAYEGAGDLVKANGLFQRATEVDARDPDAWYGLGVTCLNIQKSAVEQLRTLDVNSAYARSLVAESFVSQGRSNDAIQIYRKLVEDPAGPPCLRSALGFASLQAGNFSLATEMFQQDLKNSRGCLQARLGQARLSLDRGDVEEACKELNVVWDADRNFLEANLNRVWDGLDPERLRELQAYLQPIASPSPRAELAGFLANSISASSPNAMTDSGVSQIPRDNEAMERPPHSSEGARGVLNPERLTTEGRYTECAARLKPRMTQLQLSQSLLLARCAYDAADYRTSLLASENALQLDPQDLPALYWRAKSAEKLAIHALVRTSTEAPDSFRTHLLLAEAHRSKEEFKAAESEFDKVIAMKPDDPTAHLGLAKVHYANTRFSEALKELEAVLKADPGNPEASFLMGEILVKQHQFSDAVPYLKLGLQGQPFTIPRVHSLLSTCYAAQGQISQAISELKPALPADMDGVFHYQMYRLYKAAGNNEDAAAALEQSEMLRKRTAKERQALIEGIVNP
jgi:tetratricopeptide (TPR) repeat protein